MSVILFKRSDSVDGAKRSHQEKSYRGGKVLFLSSHRSVVFNVSKRSLTAEAKKEMFPRPFPFMLGLPLFDLY